MGSKQYRITIIVFIIIFSFFISLAKISINNLQFLDVNSNYNQNEELFSPEIAYPLKPLPLWAIERNTSRIYRLFESVNFTIDTFDFPDTDYAKCQISFSNGSTRYYNMSSSSINKYSYEYKPAYNAPLGFQNVSFLVYNETDNLINSHTTYTNFTTVTNYLVNLNSTEYYIEDFLSADLIVYNFSTYDFTWNVTVVDSLDTLTQNDTLNVGKKVVNFAFPLKNETFVKKNHYYYIQLNLTDKNNGKKGTAYFPFYVKNNDPTIDSIIELTVDDLTVDELLRTEECTISVNATDIETLSENLECIMAIYNSEGSRIFLESLDFDSENLFSDEFTIPSYNPIGLYRIEVTAKDEHGGSFSKETFLTVKNNAPEIHSYTINGLSMDQYISVLYGRDLIFRFNVSDVEGVSYVKVALFSQNNEWFNITREYIGEDTEITIRTIDLVDGVWYVYFYVIDSDGAIVSLTEDYDKAPQGIRIVSDLISYYLLWILFFAGLTIGILVGVGLIYGYFKTKFRDSQKVISKKKEIHTGKDLSKKRKKSKPSKEKIEEEIEEFEIKKDEEKEETPQRKIKRKL